MSEAFAARSTRAGRPGDRAAWRLRWLAVAIGGAAAAWLGSDAVAGGPGGTLPGVLLSMAGPGMVPPRGHAPRDGDDGGDTAPADARGAEQFRLLVQQVREYAIFMLDTAGRVATWNEGARRIKQYSAGEIVGRDFTCFYPEDAVAAGLPGRLLEAARAAGQVQDEGWRVRRDGSVFWASVTITAIHDTCGALTGYGKVTRDLTQRRAAEAERERLLEHTDKRMRELRCLHRVAEEIRRESPFTELLERVAVALPEAMSRPERTRVRIRIDEYGREPAEWPTTAVEWSEPIRINGAERGVVAVAYMGGTDEAETAPAFSDDERETIRALATALGETTERRRKTRELERYARELEAFSYSVSHDLRAPLRALDGFSQALARKYPDRLDERGRDYLQRIRNASQRMSHLIDALLRLSRISRQSMQWGPVDLSALAREVVQDLRDADPGHAVEVQCQPRLRVWGDAPLLRIVLQNLLGNAWKFSRDAARPRIEFGRDAEHPSRFYVRDNGAGFDPRYADRLFGAFQRLHSESEFDGTGVGLVTVKRVVLRHGGDVWAEGTPGEGATFWFELRPAAARKEDDGSDQDDSAGRG